MTPLSSLTNGSKKNGTQEIQKRIPTLQDFYIYVEKGQKVRPEKAQKGDFRRKGF